MMRRAPCIDHPAQRAELPDGNGIGKRYSMPFGQFHAFAQGFIERDRFALAHFNGLSPVVWTSRDHIKTSGVAP